MTTSTREANDAIDASGAASAGWPYAVHPTGWFQVAWSAELPPGGVLARRYFGADLVLYREHGGAPRMLDAHCPHLGAHLGHGGRVDGADIVCPFHGWTWSGQGRNTAIPYSSRPNRGQRLRCWELREFDGVIVAWHDASARPPLWEPPAIADIVIGFNSNDCYPVHPQCSRLWPDVRVRPQWVSENIVDVAHFRYVHSARSVTTITEYRATSHRFLVQHSFASNRGMGLNIETSGLGLMVGIFSDETGVVHVELQASTPIDGDRSDLRDTVWLRRNPGSPEELTARQRTGLDRQLAELGNDVRIWEHMVYRERAPLTPEESKPYRALRQWARQFYPAATDG
jgi:phenylpropionate dioxygenase-like ring-hydroxylating dioxygenase large terminal subunit